MKRLGLFAAVLGLATGAAADPIDDFIARQMHTSHIPGVAFAVVEAGKVSAVRAYGMANLEWNMPVDGDTAFQLASATKLFTGVLLMKLAEQGKVSLDDPLARYFDDAPPEWQKIKLLQLANHTSGLTEDLGDPRPSDVAGILAAVKTKPLAYAPGSEARYGFIDFIVLRAVMEKVSGKPFETLLQDEITGPLGLKSTRFAFMKNDRGISSLAVIPKRATVYAWGEDAQRSNTFTFGIAGHSAGGLYSSVNDLAAFFAAIDDGRFLRPESLKALQTAAILPSGKPNGFGVGWTVKKYRGAPIVGHSGGPALADIVRVPDRRLTIIALANQQNYYPLLAEGIADFYLPAPPLPRGIKDTDPHGADTVRAVLMAGREGRLDSGVFTSASRDQMSDFHRGFGHNLVTALGPVQEIRLLSDVEESGVRKRRYWIRFENRPMEWMLETARDGLIEGLYPVGES